MTRTAAATDETVVCVRRQPAYAGGCSHTAGESLHMGLGRSRAAAGSLTTLPAVR